MKLLSVRASEATDSGLFKSTHPLDAPLWTDGSNVMFREGGPRKIDGWTSVATVTGAGTIRGMDALQEESGVQHLFFGDATKLYEWNGSTLSTAGTGYTGSASETSVAPASAWSFARFGNWMLATNGVDAPQIWKGTAFAALGGSPHTPATAQILMRRGPHILALNTDAGASMIEWSKEDAPEDWEVTSTGSAGFLPIRDMDGGIVAAVPVGEQIAIFGKNQMFTLNYTGAPFYFTYQPVLDGIGAVSKTACVAANRRVYGMSRTGFWMTDGVQYQYLDTLALRDYVDGILDRDNLSKVCASYDATTESVRWSIPTTATGEPTVTLAYRIPNGAWSIEGFGRTAWLPQLGVFKQPYSVLGTAVYAHNTGTDAAGAAMAASVTTKPLDMGDPNVIKYLEKISVQVRELTGTLRMRVGTQMNLDDAVNWSDYHTLDDGFEEVYVRQSGAFVTLEFSSVATGTTWALAGFDIHGTAGGSRR